MRISKRKFLMPLTRKLMISPKEEPAKKERSEAFSQLKEEVLAMFTEEELEEKGKMISGYFAAAHKKRFVTLR